MTQQRERQGVPAGGRFARMARHEVQLPQEMTGEPDTDAQYCIGVARRIAETMRMRTPPSFAPADDGALVSHFELGPRGRPYTVRVSQDGQHVTVTKLSRAQAGNPYSPESLGSDHFEVEGGPASPYELADMIADSFEQTRWWQ